MKTELAQPQDGLTLPPFAEVFLQLRPWTLYASRHKICADESVLALWALRATMHWTIIVLGYVGFVVAFMLATAVVAFFVAKQYYKAKRKGYSPVAAGTIALLGSLIGGALALAIAESILPSDWLNEAEDVHVLASVFLAPPLFTTLVVWALPSRNARRAGSRSTAYLWSQPMRWLEQGFYWSGGLVALIGVGGSWWFENPRLGPKLAGLGATLLGLPALLAFYRKRAEQPSIQAVVTRDHRPIVLYLRAFYQEQDSFTWGTKEDMARYTSAPINDDTYILAVSFEQYLGPTITEEVGPFVALGNPEDVLPPEGAAREYAEDRDWQEHFLKFAGEARAIVMEVSQSENLSWELSAIRTHGWHEKLFVITQPVPKVNGAFQRFGRAYIRAAKGIQAPRWSEFIVRLVAAGFTAGQADPGPGAVVAFDSLASTETIARGASDPADFVAPIKKRLNLLSETGCSTQL